MLGGKIMWYPDQIMKLGAMTSTLAFICPATRAFAGNWISCLFVLALEMTCLSIEWLTDTPNTSASSPGQLVTMKNCPWEKSYPLFPFRKDDKSSRDWEWLEGHRYSSSQGLSAWQSLRELSLLIECKVRALMVLLCAHCPVACTVAVTCEQG